MKPKITDQFPLTVPHLASLSGYHPELVLHLMPKPDHWSGTTPRWKDGKGLPTWSVALLLPPHEKVPEMKPIGDITPNDIPNVVAWLPSGNTADHLKLDYMRSFWSIHHGQERQWIANRAKELGGY